MSPGKYTFENTEGAIKRYNPEKLATPGTQNEEKQNIIYVGHHYSDGTYNFI